MAKEKLLNKQISILQKMLRQTYNSNLIRASGTVQPDISQVQKSLNKAILELQEIKRTGGYV